MQKYVQVHLMNLYYMNLKTKDPLNEFLLHTVKAIGKLKNKVKK